MGDGGGGGGWRTVEFESVEIVYLGRGEAITALERSWPRQWFVARERRLRFGGSGEDMMKLAVEQMWNRGYEGKVKWIASVNRNQYSLLVIWKQIRWMIKGLT